MVSTAVRWEVDIVEVKDGKGGGMTIEKDHLEHVKAVRAAHEADLMKKANVVGVGVGLRRKKGQLTDEPAIIVSVTRKLPASQLAPEDIVPRELDDVPVDVQAVGELRAFS